MLQQQQGEALVESAQAFFSLKQNVVRSKSLWQWYINTVIMFLDIIHPTVFYLKTHNISETGFCLRLQVKPTQLGLIDRASPYLQRWRLALSIAPKWRRQSSLRNVVCLK
jgi:hypothetical protein